MRPRTLAALALVSVVFLLCFVCSWFFPTRVYKELDVRLGDLTRSCNELRTVETLRETAAQATDTADLRRWITGAYGLASADLKVTTYRGGGGLGNLGLGLVQGRHQLLRHWQRQFGSFRPH